MGERRIGKRAEQKRRWDRENYRRCECGALAARKSSRCATCRAAARREARDSRWRAIQVLWLEGLQQAEIGRRLGRTELAIQVALVAMRKEGWHAPRRRPGGGWKDVPSPDRAVRT